MESQHEAAGAMGILDRGDSWSEVDRYPLE
jgi:hypothetical protein